MKYYKSEIFGSFQNAAVYLAGSIADGWSLDENAPPEMVGFSYYVSLMRDDAPVVKMTRAEILTKARAARYKDKTNE